MPLQCEDLRHQPDDDEAFAEGRGRDDERRGRPVRREDDPQDAGRQRGGERRQRQHRGAAGDQSRAGPVGGATRQPEAAGRRHDGRRESPAVDQWRDQPGDGSVCRQRRQPERAQPHRCEGGDEGGEESQPGAVGLPDHTVSGECRRDGTGGPHTPNRIVRVFLGWQIAGHRGEMVGELDPHPSRQCRIVAEVTDEFVEISFDHAGHGRPPETMALTPWTKRSQADRRFASASRPAGVRA